MRWIPTLLAASLAAAGGSALAQSGSAPANHGTAGPQATQAQPATAGAMGAKPGRKLADTDRDFVEHAAQAGLAEVQASRLAQDKATNLQVRQFADRMVQDHTKANQQLVQLARAAGAEVPTEPALLQKGKLEILQHTGKDDFDARYIDHMGVAAHKDTIEEFQAEARDGKDPALKKFAADTLPKLQEHLRMAQDLQKSMQARNDKGGSTTAASGKDNASTMGAAGATAGHGTSSASGTKAKP